MNTSQLKKFAQDARKKLLSQVEAKLSFVLTTDSAELREKTTALKQLRSALESTTREQVIEKVAYTWFNRLMALRFMDANDYQPLGIRVITPKDGFSIPELLDEAKRGNIPDELKVNRQKIYDLLDGKTPSNNPQNEAYKELLIAACNHLHTTFPFLFEKINDYTELLLPDDLTSDFSIIKDVRDGMHIEECNNVEIIGWLYQFYISEKKDIVFAAKSKVKKEDIPAATQLFTPRWIVEYMVQNTLGKLWLQNRPKSRLREHMPYFIESASLEAEDYLKIQSPEDIKFLDPASGSGHILVYAFDLFTKIYEEEGYNNSEIPQLIIQNNLYGFEIDERAAQLSALALMMKAREYHLRVFRKVLNPNILCYQDLLVNQDEIEELFKSLQIKVSDELTHDLLLMQQATNFGSLIIPQADGAEINQISEKLNQFLPTADVFHRRLVESIIDALSQLQLLAQKFHCVVANPPYMGSGNMNTPLSGFVKINYPDSKADLMACFMEGGLSQIHSKGFLGMVNQQAWMFISSFESFRHKILNYYFIDTLVQIGFNSFPELNSKLALGVTFVISKRNDIKTGIYFNLNDAPKSANKKKVFENKLKELDSYKKDQQEFSLIPGMPLAYWSSKAWIDIFAKSESSIKDFTISDGQNKTGNNDKFLRLHWEVQKRSIGIEKHWLYYLKGGQYRRWYGNIDEVINWSIDARDFYKKDKISRLIPEYLWYGEGISWTFITYKPSFRLLPANATFDVGGTSLFITDEQTRFNILALLNCRISEKIIGLFNPTLNLQVRDIRAIPLFSEIINSKEISEISKKNVALAKLDWNAHEFSGNFKLNEIIRIKGHDLVESYDFFKQLWKNNFFQLHKNEESLNLQFINIFGLEEELAPIITLEDITILQQELDRNALNKLNKKLKRDPETQLVTNYDEIELPFITNEIMAQFISYSVGCMLGRYSLDKEGLILANQGETLEDYLREVEKTESECTFLPDKDNIIPILDNEWFEDDIVGRFHQFLKVTFGEQDFGKNLAFIEEQIGKDIRRYFLRDFYADHIKRYKKRPIYWLFSSPKGSFNALIYMHRYTPDTVSNILNKYLKEFMGKLRTRREHLQHVQVSGSAADITKAIKEIDAIDKTLMELQEYERDVLYPLATERIPIDLDDGVLVNYNKFGKAVKEVAGLNDKKTKDKVRGFDWIDVTKIR